jgi:hypothetical protein
MVLPSVRFPLRIAAAAGCRKNDAGRNRTQGRSVGSCLGCRVSRMSSSVEAGTWEETSAAGVKLVWVSTAGVHVPLAWLSLSGCETGNGSGMTSDLVRRMGVPRKR